MFSQNKNKIIGTTGKQKKFLQKLTQKKQDKIDQIDTTFL